MASEEPPQMTASTEETSDAQSKIQGLQNELTKIDSLIAKEHQRQTNRLSAEHEMWQPLIEDAKSRLKESKNSQSVLDELEHLEQEENEARKDIKRQTAQKVEALDIRKSVIKGEITKRKDEMAKSASRYASIWIMVPDVLQEMFQFFVDSGDSPWTLAHTCRNWRNIALDTATLWSGIIITSNVDAEVPRRFNNKEVCNSISRLEAALARVRDAPIDLDILLGWSHEFIDLGTIETMLSFVLERSSQWRTLFLLNSEVALPGSHTFHLNFFRGPFPNLESVCLQMQNYNRVTESRGLVPFIPLVESIIKTSPNLQSVTFDGRDDGFIKGTEFIDHTPHLTLLQSDPRDLQSAYATLFEFIPDDLYVRRYSLLVQSEEQWETAAAADAANGIILQPGRRLLIQQSIPLSIKTGSINYLEVLEIIAPAGLQVSTRLILSHLKYLSVYSPTLDGLQYFKTRKLNFLRISLIEPDTPGTSPPSNTTLADIWADSSTGPRDMLYYYSLTAARLVLDGFTIQPGALRAILRRMPALYDLQLKNPRLTSVSALSELSSPHPHLIAVLIEFKHKLVTPGRIESLSEELSKVVSSRKGKGSEKKWHSIMLQVDIQSIEFVERNN